MDYFIKLLIAITLVITGTLLLKSETVSAASDYDDVVRTTSSLVLDDPAFSGSKDITNNWHNLLVNGSSDLWTLPSCNQSTKNSLAKAFAEGDVAVTQYDGKSNNSGKRVLISWREDRLKSSIIGEYYLPAWRALYLNSDSGYHSAGFTQYGNDQYALDCNNTGLMSQIISAPDIEGDFDFKVFFSTFNVIKPEPVVDYEGLDVPSSTVSLDNGVDTDKDGLSDYIESQWYPNRDNVFCDKDVIPYECAYPDPSIKDLYVEVDWMENGSTTYKPSNTQLQAVKNAFYAKDIKLHFDTGQYGGGKKIPVFTSELPFAPIANDVDFFNIKNGEDYNSANFNEDRRGIWRYMVSGNKVKTTDDNDNIVTTSTGAAYPSDDDSFIAVGRVKELNPTGQDAAIAGTIMHEIGHNLCLSKDSFSGQDPSCHFSGIDTEAGNNYASVMNYEKQFTLLDYSSGLNFLGDHDDWSSVNLGMDDFVILGADPTEGVYRGGPVFDKKVQY